MTDFLFRDDAYMRSAKATVTAIDDHGIALDRTIFYATSGGQPGDTGTITTPQGVALAVTGAVHPEGDKLKIVHLVENHALQPGVGVELALDWDRRHAMMRMHTALHLLSVAFPFAVTGGSIGADKGRLDFDMPAVPENIDALQTLINSWIDADLPVSAEWITDAELKAQPDLVKTMKV